MNPHPDFPNLYLLPQTPMLRSLFTIVRDRNAKRADFYHYSRWILRMLVDYSMNFLDFKAKEVETPIGARYKGLEWDNKVTAVSIIRAGEAIEGVLREMLPWAEIGKILLQRDKVTKMPHYYYHNLPEDIKKGRVLLLDPMLATGGSAVRGLNILEEAGVEEEKIIFLSLLSVSKGIEAIRRAYPKVKIVSVALEEELTPEAFMIPGIGDFGDRFFGKVVGRQ